MLKLGALFLITFATVTLAVPVISLVFFPLVPIFRGRPSAPLFGLISSATSMAVGMLLFGWISRKLDVEPWFLMFLVPYLAVLRNDLGRIRRAKTGQTPARHALEARGETYDPAVQVTLERMHTTGDTLGLWGAFVLLRTLLHP